MARIPVFIVHDETGGIVSIARPSDPARATILSGPGQSVLQTEVEEDSIPELAAGGHRVDIERKSVVAYTG
jgi:hypothetical protein